MDQTKSIVIVDLKPVSGMKKDGSGTWTKYNIRGNDGITYQTWDQNWFLQRKVGETVEITFYTTTYQGRNGLATSYNIVSPEGETPQTPAPQTLAQNLAQPSRENPGVNTNVAAMIAEIKRAEINIIAAIRVHCGTELAHVEKKIPVITETENGNYKATELDSDDGDSNPF